MLAVKVLNPLEILADQSDCATQLVIRGCVRRHTQQQQASHMHRSPNSVYACQPRWVLSQVSRKGKKRNADEVSVRF